MLYEATTSLIDVLKKLLREGTDRGGTFDKRGKKKKRVSRTAAVGRLGGCLLGNYYDSVNQENEG